MSDERQIHKWFKKSWDYFWGLPIFNSRYMVNGSCLVILAVLLGADINSNNWLTIPAHVLLIILLTRLSFLMRKRDQLVQSETETNSLNTML